MHANRQWNQLKHATCCWNHRKIAQHMAFNTTKNTNKYPFNRQTQPIILLLLYLWPLTIQTMCAVCSEQWDKCLLQNITFNWNINFDVRFILNLKAMRFWMNFAFQLIREMIECQYLHGWWPFKGLPIQPLAVSSMFSIGNQNRYCRRYGAAVVLCWVHLFIHIYCIVLMRLEMFHSQVDQSIRNGAALIDNLYLHAI